MAFYASGDLSSLFKGFERNWYPGTKLMDDTQIYQVLLKTMRLKNENHEVILEGMSLEVDRNIYLANDNDFGIADPNLVSKVWKLPPRNALPR